MGKQGITKIKVNGRESIAKFRKPKRHAKPIDSVFKSEPTSVVSASEVSTSRQTTMTPIRHNANIKPPKQFGGGKYKWLYWGALAVAALFGAEYFLGGGKQYYNNNIKVVDADESPCDSTDMKKVEEQAKKLKDNTPSDDFQNMVAENSEIGLVRLFNSVKESISNIFSDSKAKTKDDNIKEEKMTPELKQKADSINRVHEYHSLDYSHLGSADIIEVCDNRSRTSIPSYDEIMKKAVAKDNRFTIDSLGVATLEPTWERGAHRLLSNLRNKDEEKQENNIEEKPNKNDLLKIKEQTDKIETNRIDYSKLNSYHNLGVYINKRSENPLMTEALSKQQNKNNAKANDDKKIVKPSIVSAEKKKENVKTNASKPSVSGKEFSIVKKGDCAWNMTKSYLRNNPEVYKKVKAELTKKLGYEPDENTIISKITNEIEIRRKTKMKKQNPNLVIQGDTIDFSPVIHKIA